MSRQTRQSAEVLSFDDRLYPLRKVTGTGYWENGRLTIDSPQPARRHVLNESAAAVLLNCDGIHSTREVIELTARNRPDYLQDRVRTEIRECLARLADNLLIEFAACESRAAPAVRVAFLNFQPGFEPTHNYFSRMMASHMLAIVVDGDEADISFQYFAPGQLRPDDQAGSEGIRVLVSDDADAGDLACFDYVFSARDVDGESAARHCRLAREDYMDWNGHTVPPSVSQRFHDFLFPADLDDLPLPLLEASAGPGKAASPAADCAPMSDAGELHVLFSVDRRQGEGLLALINSIVANSTRLNEFVFHVLVDDEPELYSQTIDTRITNRLRYEVVAFPQTAVHQECTAFLESNMRVEGNVESCQRLSNRMNFARLYLPEIFPDVERGLYLDADLIVQSDLAAVFRTDLSSRVAAAVLDQPFDYYHTGLRLRGWGFNAGVLLIDFRQWRRYAVGRAIERLMGSHRRTALFRGGTQPLLNVVLNGCCTGLDASWNVTGLGYEENIERSTLDDARILHWNGSRKPWHDDGLYKDLWEPYRVDVGALNGREGSTGLAGGKIRRSGHV